MKKYGFLKEENSTIYVNKAVIEIQIPRRYFKDKMAEYRGSFIQSLGIYDFIVYPDEKRDKRSGIRYSLSLPMNVQFEFDESFTMADPFGKDELGIECFILKDGEVFVESDEMVQSADSTKNFITKFNNGKLSSSVKYEDILGLWINSMMLNGVNLNNASAMYELIISELARNSEDDDELFRITINEHPNRDRHDYQLLNLTELPAKTSTFSALMSNYFDRNVEKSILRSKQGKSEEETPLESTLKY